MPIVIREGMGYCEKHQLFLTSGQCRLCDKEAREYSVGGLCPICHKARLQRGVKVGDKVQVFCPCCGFMADRTSEKP